MSDEYSTQPSIGGVAGESIEQDNISQEEQAQANQTLKEEIKKYKLKYRANDQDYEEEFDEAQLSQRLSLAAGAHKKMNDADKVYKETMQLIQLMRTDPRMALQNVAFKNDPKLMRSWLEQELGKDIEHELMSPEQKERMREKQELDRYKNQEQAYKKEMERRQYEYTKQQSSEKMNGEIMTAIESHNLSNDPEVKTQMLMEAVKFLYADRQRAYMNGGQATLTIDQAVKRAKEGYNKSLTTLLGKMNDEALYDFLGQEGIKKIRGVDLRRIKKGPSSPISSSNESTSAPRQQEQRKTMNEREYSDFLRGKR